MLMRENKEAERNHKQKQKKNPKKKEGVGEVI